MRILMVIPQKFYSTRGTPLSAYHRTRELVALGHAVDILTYRPGANPPNLVATVYRAAGPHFASDISPGPSRLKIWFDTLLLGNLFWRLVRKRYDLIYAHEEGAFLARVAGGLLGVPYIYDMHSSLPLQITEWKFSASRRVVGLFQWIERFAIGGARAVVAISPAVERAARSAVPSANVVTIVNHFELGEAVTAVESSGIRAKYGIAADAPLVVYTGSFVELQALPLLIDAVPLICQQVPGGEVPARRRHRRGNRAARAAGGSIERAGPDRLRSSRVHRPRCPRSWLRPTCWYRRVSAASTRRANCCPTWHREGPSSRRIPWCTTSCSMAAAHS